MFGGAPAADAPDAAARGAEYADFFGGVHSAADREGFSGAYGDAHAGRDTASGLGLFTIPLVGSRAAGLVTRAC